MSYNYLMDKKSTDKKNPCPDCEFCQFCSDTRCGMCRPSPKKKKKDCCKKEDKPLFRTY
ncbi:MAG: hypothetical protein HQL10_06515 [Nitrospirae bacterium]|nr:hypothetical protein [Nitrospirota bacterium]